MPNLTSKEQKLKGHGTSVPKEEQLAKKIQAEKVKQLAAVERINALVVEHTAVIQGRRP